MSMTHTTMSPAVLQLCTMMMLMSLAPADAWMVPARSQLTAAALRPSSSFYLSRSSLRSSPSSSSSETSTTTAQEQVAALRAAAAKAREEAERLAQELGKTSASATATVSAPKKTAEEVQQLVPNILQEADLAKQEQAWQDLKQSQSVTAFGSASLRTFPVSLSMLEQRLGLTALKLGLDDATSQVALDDFKWATLAVLMASSALGVLSLAVLPPNVGATVCYLAALLPILFVGIGSSSPEIIANAIAVVKGEAAVGDNQEGEQLTAQQRICRHEAAHFCCGYWCGLPVRGYTIQQGVARVEFDVASPTYSSTQVAALTVTALAGLVGEALAVNSGRGMVASARQDLLQLDQILRRSQDFIGAAAQQDLTRWGALTAGLLLRQHADRYEQVVAAFERQAPLEECVALLES